MRFSMLYSGEKILSFKPCLLFYTGESLNLSKSTLNTPVATNRFLGGGYVVVLIFA